MSLSNTAQQLQNLLGKNYIDTQKIVRYLELLDIHIPPHEIDKLNSLLPKQITQEDIDRIKHLTKTTNQTPIAIQLPSIIIQNDQETPFDINLLTEICHTLFRTTPYKNPFYLCSPFTKDSRFKTSTGHLQVFSTSPIYNSYNLAYKEQVSIQQDNFGNSSELKEDFIMTTIISYLLKVKVLTEKIRTNILNIYELPVTINDSPFTNQSPFTIEPYAPLYFANSTTEFSPHLGIGASLTIKNST